MVSVILPFYNAEETLARAVNSVLEQNYQDFELLLVDNNSTDKSCQIAKQYTIAYPNVSLYTEEKQGVVHAMNKGLQEAKGEWIARIDADDEWFDDKLSAQMDFLQKHPKTEVLGTQVKFNSNLKADGLAAYVAWSNSLLFAEAINASIFVESPLVNPSVVFKKDLVTKYGNYKKGDFPEDYEMFLRWHRAGVNMAKLDKELMVWNDGEKRLTRTNTDYSAEAFNKIKCFYLADWLKINNTYYPKVWIWGAGRKTRLKAEKLENYGVQIEGYIDIKENKTSILPCVHFKTISSNNRRFIVSFVSNRGKGNEIRQYLLDKGFIEQKDFVIAG